MRITFSAAAEASWPAVAGDYLQRGNGSVAVVESGADVLVSDDPARGSRHQGADDRWVFTDAAGAALMHSAYVVDAVSRRTTVEVQLRAGDRVLAAGVTDVRRSVAATVDIALRSAGPLIEMAVSGVVPVLPGGDRGPPEPVTAGAAARAAQWAFAGRVARAAVTYRQWGVARLPAGSVEAVATGNGSFERGSASTPLTWHSPPPNHFWADPCVVAQHDQCWLFVEELDRSTGRGCIRALQWDGGQLQPGPIVFATAHHLSFPQVQFVAGRWLATVETCAAANPILTFDRLGDQWRIATDLPPLPPHMADPVIEFDGEGRPSLLTSTDAVTSPDAHYVEHTFGPDGWQRIPGATYVDVTSARGGGSRSAGIRAVQDCAGVYGRALHLVPEVDWHGTRYGEPLMTLTGGDVSAQWQPAGVHTLTWTPDQEHVWIDGWRRRKSPLGGYRRLIERRHLRECDHQ